MIEYLAVYGTLKRGYGNNHRLANSTFKFEGVAKNIKLLQWDVRSFPVAVHSDGSESVVEVYEIGGNDLRSCDLLEGYDPNRPESENSFYCRKTIEVEGLDCHIYIGGASWNVERLMEVPKDEKGRHNWSR